MVGFCFSVSQVGSVITSIDFDTPARPSFSGSQSAAKIATMMNAMSNICIAFGWSGGVYFVIASSQKRDGRQSELVAARRVEVLNVEAVDEVLVVGVIADHRAD